MSVLCGLHCPIKSRNPFKESPFWKISCAFPSIMPQISSLSCFFCAAYSSFDSRWADGSCVSCPKKFCQVHLLPRFHLSFISRFLLRFLWSTVLFPAPLLGFLCFLPFDVLQLPADTGTLLFPWLCSISPVFLPGRNISAVQGKAGQILLPPSSCTGDKNFSGSEDSFSG